MENTNTVLSVKDLAISFSQYTKGLQQKIVTPVSALDFEVKKGEVHAIIGASGSGKSLLAHAILGILPQNAICSGTIDYMGQPMTEKRKEQLRGKEIAFIPQSVNYLDPLMRVGKQIGIGLPKKEAKKTEAKLLKRYGLEPADGRRYPFELSGGMLRRVLFATSVKKGINLVVADEPTPGIHPQALSAILNQLRCYADEGAAVILITHDIVSALTISDRVTVLRDGEAIETVDAACFRGAGEQLKHPYTKALWRCLPINEFTLCKEDVRCP